MTSTSDTTFSVQLLLYLLPANTHGPGRVDEDEIEKQCDDLRAKLLRQLASGRNSSTKSGAMRAFKPGQTHEMADAKIKESDRLRRALRISNDYEEGSHWKRRDEEKTRREAEAERRLKEERNDGRIEDTEER